MNKKLTEKEELLLIKYSDTECSIVERFFARRLISKNKLAAEFVGKLDVLSNEFPVSDYALQEIRVDLWENISKRIDQEEKAEFYLGTRAAIQESKKSLIDWSKINIGIGTGLVAATLALFFTQNLFKRDLYKQGLNPGSMVSASRGNSIAMLNDNISNENLQNVSLANEPAKIDWLRSHGKVKMIKDRDTRVPVIWVNRSLPEQNKPSGRNFYEIEENSNSYNTPIILNDKAPNALSVVDRGGFSKK